MKRVYIEVNDNILSLHGEITARLNSSRSTLDKYRKNIYLDAQTWLDNHSDAEYSKRIKLSAVLIPLILTKRNELAVLLTVRNSKVSLFQGEVCLPGGKCERKDDGIIQTALRETEEEIGLLSDNVDVFDIFFDMPTVSIRRGQRYIVYPVVGLVKKGFYANLNTHEVCDVFTMPLKEFLNKPEPHPRWKIPCFKQNGILTNLTYICFGLTFSILAMTALIYYHEKPHADTLFFLSTFGNFRTLVDAVVTSKL